MDWKSKRDILYQKEKMAAASESSKTPKKEKKHSPAEEKPTQKQPIGTSKGIIEWISSHKLIKVRALCKEAEVDPGTFHRWMNITKEIPAPVIEKLIPILSEYGFEAGV